MEQNHLPERLNQDAATIIGHIAEIAPAAGLNPGDTARIDQLAARLKASQQQN